MWNELYFYYHYTCNWFSSLLYYGFIITVQVYIVLLSFTAYLTHVCQVSHVCAGHPGVLSLRFHRSTSGLLPSDGVLCYRAEHRHQETGIEWLKPGPYLCPCAGNCRVQVYWYSTLLAKYIIVLNIDLKLISLPSIWLVYVSIIASLCIESMHLTKIGKMLDFLHNCILVSHLRKLWSIWACSSLRSSVSPNT